MARSALCFIGFLLVSGCANQIYRSHGYTPPEKAEVSQTRMVVNLPKNAPSIGQTYKQPPKQRQKGEAFDHLGIDVIGPRGLPVLALASGHVTASHFEPIYGNRIEIQHGIDSGGRMIKSKYFHLKSRVVKVGDRIRRGQQIGSLGSTGLLAHYPHLHIEIRKQNSDGLWDPFNPHLFWVDGIGQVTCFDTRRAWLEQSFLTTYPVPCKDTPWKKE